MTIHRQRANRWNVVLVLVLSTALCTSSFIQFATRADAMIGTPSKNEEWEATTPENKERERRQIRVRRGGAATMMQRQARRLNYFGQQRRWLGKEKEKEKEKEHKDDTVEKKEDDDDDDGGDGDRNDKDGKDNSDDDGANDDDNSDTEATDSGGGEQQESSGGRVSGGREVPRTEEFPRGAYPFMSTLLRLDESSSSLSMTCAGSLVAPNMILTAGHCVGFFSAVRVGVFNRSAVPDEGQLFVVESVVRNDRYRFGNQGSSFLLRYDVALVTFYGTVLDIPTVPISLDPQLLPLNASSSFSADAAAPFVIVGWGQTNEDDLSSSDNPDVRMDGTVNVLREASVVYVPNEQCRQAPNITGQDQAMEPGSTILPHLDTPLVSRINTTMSEPPSIAPSPPPVPPPSPPLSYQNLIFDDNLCVASMPPSSSGRPFPPDDQDEATVGSAGICNGDSGGPLLLNASHADNSNNDADSENDLLLVGVGSWTVGCGRAEYPSVFFRTASDVDWLRANLCRLSRGAPPPPEWNCTSHDELPEETARTDEDLRNVTVTILINITLDDHPQDTGFLLQSMGRDGTVLAYSPPGTYSMARQNVLHAIPRVPVLLDDDDRRDIDETGMISLQRLATYRFVILDLVGDGWDGFYQVTARLDKEEPDDNVASKLDPDDAEEEPNHFQLLAMSSNMRIILDQGEMATEHVFDLAPSFLAAGDSTAPSASPSMTPTTSLDENLPFVDLELSFLNEATAAYVGWKLVSMSNEQVRAQQAVGQLMVNADNRYSMRIYLRDATPGELQAYRLDLQYDVASNDDDDNNNSNTTTNASTWQDFDYRISLGRHTEDSSSSSNKKGTAATIAENQLYQGRFMAPQREQRDNNNDGASFRRLEEFLFTVVWYQEVLPPPPEEEKLKCNERSKGEFTLLKNVQENKTTQHWKTCKWLRRKANKAKTKICNRQRSPDAHAVCPKTCGIC